MERRMDELDGNLEDVAGQIGAIVHHNTGEDLKLTYINGPAEEYTGISLQELDPMGPEFFKRFMHPKTVREAFPRYVAFLRSDDSVRTCAEIELVKDFRETEYNPLLNIAKLNRKTGGSISLSIPLKNLHRSVSTVFLTLYQSEDNFFVKNYPRYHRLTRREREILSLIADGFTSSRIGDKLGISKLTVDVHRKNIVQKLEVPNLSSLLQFAVTFSASTYI
jgi:DNA-binding CsgD family transcriptional regulator